LAGNPFAVDPTSTYVYVAYQNDIITAALHENAMLSGEHDSASRIHVNKRHPNMFVAGGKRGAGFGSWIGRIIRGIPSFLGKLIGVAPQAADTLKRGADALHSAHSLHQAFSKRSRGDDMVGSGYPTGAAVPGNYVPNVYRIGREPAY
jgi:hypothetical protein